MRRFLAAFGGFAAGLALTWLCLYTLSHANLSPKTGRGCDAEHCGPWWALPLGVALYLIPTIGFAIAGYLSVARAWSRRKTFGVFGLLAIGAVFFMVRPYL